MSLKECYKNSITVDPSVKSVTYVWFKDGYLKVKGNFLEVAAQIYNLTTVRIINEYGTNEVIQNIKIYLDDLCFGKQLKDILESQYDLKVYSCKNYGNDRVIKERLSIQPKIYERIDDGFKFEREYKCQWIGNK